MDLISAIDEIPELEISGYSTSTATTIPTSSTENDYNLIGNWNDWSPVVDWEKLSDSYFPDLNHYHINDEEHDGCLDQSPSSRDTCHSFDYSETNNDDNLKGLKLVHLLMAAAESVTKSRDLARVILARLKQLVSTSHGTNMERLAAYFTDALCNLLESAGGSKNTMISNEFNRTDKIAAFQLLQDMSPCLKFGHFTANQAILESVGQDRRIHIVDYDIMEGIQWASLMQALVAKKDCPPPHLRITAISRGGNGNGIGRRSIGTVQETGRRLASFAVSIGQPFSFHQCKLESDESFRPCALKLVRGETLLVNCMLHLPHFNHRTSDSVISFLSGVKSLSPRLVTLVEQAAETTIDQSFMGRFMDTLHHYSALYDSLEAGFPMQARARALVERVFLGPQINQSLARVYRREEEEEEESRCWWKWMASSCGVKAVNISFANNCQAKLLLGLFNDGYKVEEMGNNRLVLGWKSRNLLSASIWTCC